MQGSNRVIDIWLDCLGHGSSPRADALGWQFTIIRYPRIGEGVSTGHFNCNLIVVVREGMLGVGGGLPLVLLLVLVRDVS